MPVCDNCGNHVTDSYHRVFSANDGVLYGCTNCSIMGRPKHPDRTDEYRKEEYE